MLSSKDNSLICQVGYGTPGGSLLRRYWHPLAIAKELSDDNPTKFVRVLGEDLVLFRDKSGRTGLIADHCPHRGASLLYGRVEERGISCAYHGWLMDCGGNILETPPERNEAIIRSVRTVAYPTLVAMGMIWGYLGPDPAPVLPHFDMFNRRDGQYRISEFPRLDANWFTAAENAVDSTHLQILHQAPPFAKEVPENTTRGFIDDIESSEYYEVSYGIMKKRTYKDGVVDEHPMVFPLWLRTRNSMWMRTPIDDEHTMHWTLSFEKNETGAEEEQEPRVEYVAPLKEPAEAVHPVARFEVPARRGWPLSEDVVMWETQGTIPDREIEHLADSDRGVVMLRRMTLENIRRVERGEDPIGVYRDSDHEVIDTHFDRSVSMHYPTGIKTRTVEQAARRP
jgi:5,5'-dehydrodivanillate O-demethylase